MKTYKSITLKLLQLTKSVNGSRQNKLEISEIIKPSSTSNRDSHFKVLQLAFYCQRFSYLSYTIKMRMVKILNFFFFFNTKDFSWPGYWALGLCNM